MTDQYTHYTKFAAEFVANGYKAPKRRLTDGFPSPCGVKVVGNPIVLKSIYDLIFKVQILQ